MSLNLPNVGALAGSAATGTPLKGSRMHALPDDFQSLLASSFLANTQPGASLLAVRTTLQRGLTGALAPPGASPPKPSGASPPANAKLTAMIQNAGQQNEIPGTILDADPAKEPPAPQKKTAHTEALPDAAAAFARSLIAKATLLPGAQAPTGGPAGSGAATTTPTEGSAQAPSAPTSAPVPQALDAFPFAPSNVIAPPAQPAANATGNDLLARMVSRAAAAGAQRAAAPVSEAKTASTPATPLSAAFEKLASAIAASSGAQTQSQTDTQGDSSSQPHDTLQTTNGLGGAQPAMPSTVSTGAISDSKPIAPYTTVDVNAVIEQVVKGIVINNTGSGSQIRLRLQPEHLGEVAVKLTVEGNNISANVVAQNAGVRDALLGAQPALSRSLADAGLNLGAFSVNVSGGQAGSANDRQQARQPSSGFKIGGWNAGLSPDDDQPPSDSVCAPAQSGARSMVINSLA